MHLRDCLACNYLRKETGIFLASLDASIVAMSLISTDAVYLALPLKFEKFDMILYALFMEIELQTGIL